MISSFSRWISQRRKKGQTTFHHIADAPRSLGLFALEDRTLPTTLGTYALLEGPSAGSNSDLVITTGSWSATTSDSWLHTTSTGTGNGMASFTFDTNSGPTRTGSISIAGQTLTVTQAAAGTTAAAASTLPNPTNSLGLYFAQQAAADAQGNFYIADAGHNDIVKYDPVLGTLEFMGIPGLNNPAGVAVDATGSKIFIADTYNNSLKEYVTSTSTITTLISGLNSPQGAAIDSTGIAYVADTSNNRVLKYDTNTSSSSVFLTGISTPRNLAVDAQDNLYISSNSGNVIKLYDRASASLSDLVTGLASPWGLAVDGGGNVYIGETTNGVVSKYNRSTSTLSTLATGIFGPDGLAVSPAGDVTIVETTNYDAKFLPLAYLDTTSLSETQAAGTDSVSFIAASAAGLSNSLAPKSDQGWLTVTGIAGYQVNIAFTANTGASSRTATLTILGQSITVTQAGQSMPTVGSPTATNITSGTATLGGTLVDPGISSVTKRGILYANTSINANPTIGSTGVNEVDDTATTTGAFSEIITGLTPGTGYSYVAFATNGSGTAYTTVSTFSTHPTVQFTTSTQSVSASTGTFTITVSLSSASALATTVPFTIAGSAANGIDYSGITSSPLVIPAGATSRTITGTLINHGYAPTNKDILFTLGSSPVNADLGVVTTNDLTILSDPMPSVQFTTATQSVSALAGTFTITAQLSGPSTLDTLIPFSLGGTAVNGQDYSSVTASPIVIPAGSTSTSITGTIINRGYTPINKTIGFTLGSSPVNATLGAISAEILTILSVPMPSVQFSVPVQSVNATAGAITITAQLSAPSAVNTTIPFTLGGTALNGLDYSIATSSPLVIPAGSTTGTIIGAVINRGYTPTNKTIAFTLGASPVNATLGAITTDTLTIISVPMPSVQFSTATQSVNATSGSFTVTAQLSAPSSVNTTIPFTLSGTAVNGTDYSGVSASPLTILAGTTSASITGTLLANNFASSNPALIVTMGTPTNATVGAITSEKITIVEPAPSNIIDAGGLEFRNVAGFTSSGNTYNSSGLVQVGYIPGSGQTFVPILNLQSNTAIDKQALTFSSQGTVAAVLGSSKIDLLSNGFSGASISSLIGVGIAGLSGSAFSVKQLLFRLNTIALSSTGTNGPSVQLQGALTLPYSLVANVSGTYRVVLDKTGTFLTGVTASIPTRSFTLGNVQFSNVNITASYNTATDTISMSGSGSAAISAPGGSMSLSLTFGSGTTPGIAFKSGALTNFDASVSSTFKTSGVTFTTKALTFSYSSASSTFSMAGTASAAITGLGSLGITFGYGTNPGLVVTNGALVSLDTTVNSTFTASGVTFTSQNLRFNYLASTDRYALSGTAGVNVAGIGNMNLTFGYGASPGLVVSSGSLVSLDTTLNSDITLSNITFKTTGLEFKYAASNSLYSLQGTTNVTVPKLGSLALTFGFGTKPGIVITNGSLDSLDLTLNTDIKVGGVTIKTSNLEFTYTTANTRYTLSGSTSATIPNLGTINLIFGYGTNPGLVITNGSLDSLDLTLNSDLKLGGVAIKTTGLEFKYLASNSLYSLAGTASATIAKIGNVSLTFGYGTKPGLVISNGSLDSLDLTLNSDLKLGGVTIKTTGLEFTYTAAKSQYTLAGTASLTIQKFGTVSVTFGYGSNPGLVITNGSLVSLDMTLNSNVRIGSVNITTNGLRFTYTAASDTYTLGGTATVNILKLGTLSVTFGYGSNPGLVITNGSLVSLDLTLNSDIRVNSVLITTKGLEFTYTATTDTYTLAGTAGVTVLGIGDLSVTFGHDKTPGLVIADGSLVSLDMTVNSNIRVNSVVFSTKGLEFTFTTATSTFTLSGTAGITIIGMGNVFVTFGHGTTPGLVITDGNLVSLDMTLNSDMRVGAVVYSTKGLEFTYTTATSTFTLAGTAGATIAGIANLSVTFGHGTTPGLVITNGSLVNLDMTVASNIKLGPVTIGTTGLEFKYVTATDQFTLTGSAGVNITGIGGLTVTFGNGTKPGLLITNGSLVSANMTISSDMTIGALKFGGSGIEFNYVAAASQFTIKGDTSVTIAKIGTITATFGHGTTPGILVTNGSLVSMELTVNSKIGFAGLTFANADLAMSYLSSTSTFTIHGLSSFPYGVQNIALRLGDSNNSKGILIVNGDVTNVDASATDTFGAGGITFGSVNLHMVYNASANSYDFTGTGDVTITASLPSSLSSLLSYAKISAHLGSVNLTVHEIPGNNADSYTSISTSIAGYSIGIKVSFNGSISVTGIPDFIINGLNFLASGLGGLFSALGLGGVFSSITGGLSSAGGFISSGFSSFTSSLPCVFDNQLAGATVFYDANSNGILDTGESSTTTYSDGTYNLSVPKDGAGQLVAFGGINVGTNLPNTMILTSPLSGSQISPLSTMLQSLRTTYPSLSEDQAAASITLALGLPTTIDFRYDNIVSEAVAGNADAAKALTAAVEVAGLVDAVKAILGSTSGSSAVIGSAVISNLINALSQASSTIDLTDSALIINILQGTADQTGVELDPVIALGAANSIANINKYIQSQPAAGGTEYMTHVVQAQIVAGKQIVPILSQVASGQADIATVVSQTSIDSFAKVAQATPVGTIAAAASNSSPNYAVAAGAGGSPRIQVMSRQTGATLADFFALEPSFRGGSSVAMGDVNGDGTADVVVAAGAGGAARVMVIDGTKLDQVSSTGQIESSAVIANFYAFEESFRGGATVALARLTGGLGLDIVVGAGLGGGPRVKTFHYTPGTDGSVTQLQGNVGDFFAFDPDSRFGVNVAAGDLDHIGRDDIIVGAGVGGAPVVAVFYPDGTLRNQFMAYDPNLRGGVSVAVGYLDETPTPQIVTGPGIGSAPVVNVYNVNNTTPERSIPVFETAFTGGVNVSSGPAGPNNSIVIGAGAGGGPRVGVLTADGLTYVDNYYPFESNFNGGVLVG